MEFIKSISLEIIISILTSLSAIIVYIGKKKIDDNKRKKETLFIKKFQEKIDIEYLLETKVWEILEIFKCDRVGICRFHNGNNYQNKQSMDKFSMTNEAISEHVSPIFYSYQNIPISSYIIILKPTIHNGHYLCPDVEIYENQRLKSELISNQIKSYYLFTIEATNKTPLGFMFIAYKTGHVLKEQEMKHLMDISSNIGLLLDFSNNFKMILES